MLILVLRAQKQSTSASHVRQDAIPRVKESRGRERGRHAFIACVLNEWVCWRGRWNGWNKRSGGGGGEDGKTRGLCNGPIKIKKFICIHAVASHVLRPGANAKACTCGIQAGGSQHSHSHVASTRSADPGTSPSLYPSSPISR